MKSLQNQLKILIRKQKQKRGNEGKVQEKQVRQIKPSTPQPCLIEQEQDIKQNEIVELERLERRARKEKRIKQYERIKRENQEYQEKIKELERIVEMYQIREEERNEEMKQKEQQIVMLRREIKQNKQRRKRQRKDKQRKSEINERIKQKQQEQQQVIVQCTHKQQLVTQPKYKTIQTPKTLLHVKSQSLIQPLPSLPFLTLTPTNPQISLQSPTKQPLRRRYYQSKFKLRQYYY